MSEQQAIGIFDSGIGGLSVLREIQQLLPAENLLYIADSANAPYGNKSHDFILQRCDELSHFLLEQNVKAIVIACNTATAVAVTDLRQKYTLPIIAMEPGVKPAIAATKSGVVGVLATENTLASEQFENLLHRYAENVRVVSQPCHGLVEEIETGQFNSDAIRKLLGQYTQPLLDAGADTIVLGCTHYPLLRPLLAEMTGDDITIIDTGSAVAQQLKRKLDELSLCNRSPSAGEIKLYTSKDTTKTTELAATILQQHVQTLDLPEIKNPAMAGLDSSDS